MQTNHSRFLALHCLIALALLSTSAVAAPAKGGKKLYLEIRGVQTPAGAPANLKDTAKGLLMAELKKHPNVMVELGTAAVAKDDLEKSLRQKKALGYAIVLRVTKTQSTVKPAAPGKIYQTLSAQVDLAIDAERIPTGQMAMAGDGSSEVATEVKRVDEQERKALLEEALTAALQQAVNKAVSNLSSPPKAAAAKAKKR